MKNNKQNKGQVAIIVLLASAILLTLGISASKQTVTDTKIDTDEEALKEAFNTAESGINNYLNNGGSSYTTGGGGATVDSATIGGSNQIFSEGQVLANYNQLFWLVNHNENGSIGETYYSSNFSIVADNSDVALKVDYFYIDGSDNYQVARFGCYSGVNASFVGFGDSSNCNNISVVGKKSLLVSVTPLGGSAKITISGGSAFPLQGEELTSTGVTNSGVKTQVKTRYIYQIPSFFMEAITAANVIQ